jgi:hypothetical protein
MMASQKVAGNEVIVLSRALEILHVCLCTRESTIPWIWRLQRCHPVGFLRFYHSMVESQNGFYFINGSGSLFRQMREFSGTKVSLDAGVRRHTEKQMFPRDYDYLNR